MEELSQAILFQGYRPDFTRAIEDLTRKQSMPSDVMRLGPGLLLEDLKILQQFASLEPLDPESTRRTAIVSLESASKQVQTALLKFVEQPPPTCLLLFHCPGRAALLSTLVSRCIVRTASIPTYGRIMVDLERQGMSLEQAPKYAFEMRRGLALSEVPDDGAVAAAEGLLDAARSGNIELGVRWALQFDAKALAALRGLVAHPDRFEWVSKAYHHLGPTGIALSLLYDMITHQRKLSR